MVSESTYFFEPSKGHGLPHSPLKAIVAPRPIAWISTRSPSGHTNLAPYSFFNILCDDPPIVVFSSTNAKDTLRNAVATGEFVVNLVTRDLAQKMNASAAPFAYGESEIDELGLQATEGSNVRAPRIVGSPASLECKVLNIRELSDLGERPVGWHAVMGQVVGVHIDRRYLSDGIFETAQAGLIARCGYRGDYVAVEKTFEMLRPLGADV